MIRRGWGVIALCPPGLEPSARGAWLDAIVDQVVTFLDGEYEVALVSSFPTTLSGWVNLSVRRRRFETP
jgi:hypothetical protein